MTDMFGQYKSQETRALESIESSKYPDTNKDLEANIRRLNVFVDYLAQYVGQMQKGVDQANRDIIGQSRDMLSNIVILLGGGTITDVDFGDLQYYLPAIGALLGFDSDTPFPLNLFEAAEHFFLGYVVPLDSFAVVIGDQITALLTALGISPEFIEAFQQLMSALTDVTSDLWQFIQDLSGLLEIFGISTDGLGPLADIWHVLTQLLGGLSLKTIGELTDPVFKALAPWVETLSIFVEYLDKIIKSFSGGLTDIQGVLNFSGIFTSIIPDFNTPELTTNPISAWADIFALGLQPLQFFGDLGTIFGAALGGGEVEPAIQALIDHITALPEVFVDFVNSIVDQLIALPDLLLSLLMSLVDLLLAVPDVLLQLLTGLINLLLATPEILTNLLDGLVELLVSIPTILTSLLTGLIDLLVATPTILATLLTSLIELLAETPTILMDLLNSLITLLVATPDILTTLLTSLMNLLVTLPTVLIDLAEALIASGAGLLGADSPLNALNLFNLVPTALLGQISISNIGNTFTNLIADPNFLDITAFSGGDDWHIDATGGYQGLGAAWTTADAHTHELLGNLIAVSPGQTMPISGMAKWQGLAGSGTPIALAITGYLNNAATVQTNVATHNVSPPTTDFITLSGTYTVPSNVDALRTRLVVGATATAGKVWFSNLSAGKTGMLLPDLVKGLLPNNTLTDELTKTVNNINTMTTDILDRVTNGNYTSLLQTLGAVSGNYTTALSQISNKLASFLTALSGLNGSNINVGAIADRFIPGITSIIDTLVKAFGGYSGSGYTYPTLQSIFNSGRLSIVDNTSNITNLNSRTSVLESTTSALQQLVNGLLHPFGTSASMAGPMAAGPMALAGPSVSPMAAPVSAFGGATGVSDSDDFERFSSTSVGPQWLTTYSGGAGVWATPGGHDARFAVSGTEDREFLCIRNDPDIVRSDTDYQRVTKVLSKSAGWLYDVVSGEWSYCGYNDIWLRISDDTTSLDDVTGTRVRFGGDGSIYIDRFIAGIGTELAYRGGEDAIYPPGPGAAIIGEAGLLRDQITRYFRAMIGISTLLEIQEIGVASKVGIAYRRWGHGGKATGHVDAPMIDFDGSTMLMSGQQPPGDTHYWNGVDQII